METDTIDNGPIETTNGVEDLSKASKSTTNETNNVAVTQSSLTSDMLDINENETAPPIKKSQKATQTCPDCNRSGLKSLGGHKRWCKKINHNEHENYNT